MGTLRFAHPTLMAQVVVTQHAMSRSAYTPVPGSPDIIITRRMGKGVQRRAHQPPTDCYSSNPVERRPDGHVRFAHPTLMSQVIVSQHAMSLSAYIPVPASPDIRLPVGWANEASSDVPINRQQTAQQ